MDALVCTKCGGTLDEDYVCPYCGTRYKKPDTPQPNVTNNNSTTYNIVINTTSDGFDVPGVKRKPEPEAEPEPEPESETPVVTEEEQPPQEEESGFKKAATSFASKSIVLYACALIGIPVLLYLGKVNDNPWYWVGALGAAGIVYFISKYFKEG